MSATKPLGPEPTCPPFDPNPKIPKFTPPPHACDSHFHVFGPAYKFPYAPDRTFTPYDAQKEKLFSLHKLLGFERGVFVHSSCHGSDHAVLIDMLKSGGGRYRGGALLKGGEPMAEIRKLHDAGVCGVRFHFFSHLAAPPAYDSMRDVIKKVAPLGWHIAIHVGGQGMLEQHDFITSIEAPVVIDHIGRIDISEGLNGKAFTALRRLLDRGNIWVKLSGLDRITKQPMPYRDAIPFARSLAEHAPERVVWGSDWPHPNHQAVPNDGDLVDLVPEIAPDPKTRHLMLVDNPAKLFGFT